MEEKIQEVCSYFMELGMEINNVDNTPISAKAEKAKGDLLAFLEKQIYKSEEKGFMRGFNDCKEMVEKGEHIDCCIIPGSKKECDCHCHICMCPDGGIMCLPKKSCKHCKGRKVSDSDWNTGGVREMPVVTKHGEYGYLCKCGCGRVSDAPINCKEMEFTTDSFMTKKLKKHLGVKDVKR